MKHATLDDAAVPPLMMLRPWSLRSWPPLFWQAGAGAPAGLHHVGTQVTLAELPFRRHTGQTVWVGSLSGREIGMAWDWIEIARGVIAMADPMSVITNLRVVADEGHVLTSAEASMFLNDLVQQLPWQDEVGRALGACH